MKKELIEQGVALLLRGLEVPEDHNFERTPQRVAKLFAEVFSPPEIEIPVFDESYTDEVILRGHQFYTFCPHHLLPVKIVASIAYIPNGKVIGASKLARLMHDVNRIPMTQEALTSAILERLNELTEGTARGGAVFLEGEHGCMKVRGVRSHDSSMITFRFAGEYTDPERQRLFLHLCGVNGR